MTSPNYNYYSDEAMQVATDAIRAEADTWRDLAKKVDALAPALNGFELPTSAFSVVDPYTIPAASDLSTEYGMMHAQLRTLLNGAAVEFDNFSSALKKAADWYEESDQNSVVRISKIYGEARD